MTVPDGYLACTPSIDCDHPAVREYANRNTVAGTSVVEMAVSLYYAVRDDFRYNPYKVDLTLEEIRASATLSKGYGWCVSKAVLLAACCRAKNIPARLGFGDVRNHLSTERLRRLMKTDVFYWHGFTDMYLEGVWVKATPAFNLQLCEKFGFPPLEFNGREDSVFHPFDNKGNRHMEYLHDRGRYHDLPLTEIRRTFAEHYSDIEQGKDADFDADVSRETAR
ncbi:transglutaminase-like domain-containing protein [Desulfosediminicola sp.]|uniref:transglutaminase-like domain-containing protein n=1 Tax=Desulfosediminicola sp. TaxID=2886825 RepID=UPI003AF26A22